MQLKLNQLTIFDYLIEDPVLICVKQLIEATEKQDKYFELIRLLLDKNQNFSEYILFHMIHDAKEKVMQLIHQESLSAYQLSCLDNDLTILFDILSLDLKALAKQSKDERYILAKMEKESNNKLKPALQIYLNFFATFEEGERKGKAEAFVKLLKTYGVGQFSFDHGFLVKVQGDTLEFSGVESVVTLGWEQIYLYERQKQALYNNTKAFVEGYASQHALLVGGSGTGKSTSVKTVAKLFAHQGLRLIQMQKGQLMYLPKVLNTLKNQGFKFIIFIDDLSFEANEDEYKFLKSFIEGSILDDFSHIVFYVTSNRRHLIKEIRTERENDIHLQDFIQEMTSLSDRFGLTLIYENLDQKEYFLMVQSMAKKEGVQIDEELILKEARIFAMRHGKMSGRVAAQFIRQLKLDQQLNQ